MRSFSLSPFVTLIALVSSVALGACSSGEAEERLDGPAPWELRDAGGVSISQISIYQGVKVVLMENGQPGAATVPIVAGRDALLRAWVNADAGYNGEPVLARLHIDGAESPIETTVTGFAAPVEGDLASTLNFQIPGTSIAPGFSYRLELLQTYADSPGDNAAAHYPAEGFAGTNTISVGASLKIVLVPVQYGADGSNRIPDTSEAMIEKYRSSFLGMYPAPSVEVTVREPLAYTKSVSANGYGWEDLLARVSQLRQQDGAAFDVYYYGIFNPSASLASFCQFGCVAGLSNLAFGPGDSYSRASIGIGFTDDGGQTALETAVHEVGHAHGRQHSPCGGAQGTDPGYPYPQAAIGVWGYDIAEPRLLDPGTKDVMSYCFPIWVSDYTYVALMNRIQGVNQTRIVVPAELRDLTYDRAYVDGDGELHWLPPVQMEAPPQGEAVAMDVEVGGSLTTLTGHFYPYSHLPGGVFVWPQAGAPSRAVTVEWQGVFKTLEQQD